MLSVLTEYPTSGRVLGSGFCLSGGRLLVAPRGCSDGDTVSACRSSSGGGEKFDAGTDGLGLLGGGSSTLVMLGGLGSLGITLAARSDALGRGGSAGGVEAAAGGRLKRASISL